MSHNAVWAAVLFWGSLMGIYLWSGIVFFSWMPIRRSETPSTYWGYMGVYGVIFLILLWAALEPSPYGRISS